MLASLIAILALSQPVSTCETIAQLAKPTDEKQAAAKPEHEHAETKPVEAADNALETRLNELGKAIQNLSKQISANTKQGAKTADDRIRREFETIKKGLAEATNGAETKAKEAGSEVSSELKVALKKLSRSIDELANKVN